MFRESPKEELVGLDLRAPEATSPFCPHVSKVLLGPFFQSRNSGKKILGSALHPGHKVPASTPPLALKAMGFGQLPALFGLELLSVCRLDPPLSSQAPGPGVRILGPPHPSDSGATGKMGHPPPTSTVDPACRYAKNAIQAASFTQKELP